MVVYPSTPVEPMAWSGNPGYSMVQRARTVRCKAAAGPVVQELTLPPWVMSLDQVPPSWRRGYLRIVSRSTENGCSWMADLVGQADTQPRVMYIMVHWPFYEETSFSDSGPPWLARQFGHRPTTDRPADHRPTVEHAQPAVVHQGLQPVVSRTAVGQSVQFGEIRRQREGTPSRNN